MKNQRTTDKWSCIGCGAAAALISVGAVPAPAAPDAWGMRATGQAVLGTYIGSDLRDSLYAAGVFIGSDYLEQGGFTVGYNYTQVKGKADEPGDFDTLEESTFYLGGRLHSYADNLGGRLTWRLDSYFIRNEADVKGSEMENGVVWNDGDINVLNPVVGFINNEKTLAYDLGYAYSNYDFDSLDEYQAHQLTPTVGFAVGGQSNWVQLRGYFIHQSDGDVNDGKSDTAALEAKWTHWLNPGAVLGLHSIGVNALLGERFLAVDPDATVVYTLADEQQSSIALNGSWKLGERTSVLLQLGYEQYENGVLNDDYEVAYLYLNLSHDW